jgi:hypothetical protein
VDGRTVRLDAAFLRDHTADGEPTLLHGYAVTGHVAQGMTVDRAFVLAGEGIYHEWVYTAMSRGREGNHLYVADLGARAEFAPMTADQREPIDRLAAALRASAGTSMAIDAGEVAPIRGDDHDRRQNEAEAARRAAWARRSTLEHSWTRWLPHRRAQLRHVMEDERAAIEELRRLSRLRAERNHAARPDALEPAGRPWLDAAHDRRAERQLAQDVRRDHGIGRSV